MPAVGRSQSDCSRSGYPRRSPLTDGPWFLARGSRREPKTGWEAARHWSALHLDLREQVGADREQDRGEEAQDREVGRGAELKTAAERAAQAVDTVAEWVEPHGEPHRPRQFRHWEQRARKKKSGSTMKFMIS